MNRNVVIQDGGDGIKVVNKDYIFKPFFTQDLYLGHGIGLAFCHVAMEFMGGEIKCDFSAKKGARFHLIFP